MSNRHRARRGGFGTLGDPYTFGRLGTRPILPNEAPDGFDQQTHDFTQMDRLPSQITFARTGTAWDYQFRQYASGVPRLVQSLGWLIEEARTNKCANFNVGQGGTANMTPFGGASIEAVPLANVPDAVRRAFNAKGFDASTVTGIFKLTGNASSGVDPAGAAGNTNQHALSVFAYVAKGSGTLQFSDGLGPETLKTDFERTVNVRAPFTGIERLQISLTAANSEVWFFGNQMEEGYGDLSPIVTNGASQGRNAESASEPISRTGDATLSATFDAKDWSARADGGARVFKMSDGTNTNRIEIFSVDSQNKVRVFVQATATRFDETLTPDVIGLNKIDLVVSAGNYQAFLNNNQEATGNDPGAPPATTTVAYGYDNVANARRLNSYLRTFVFWSRVLDPPPSGFDSGFDGGFGG